MNSLRITRLLLIIAASVLSICLSFLFASFSAWNEKREQIELPAQEFGLTANYPQGFWVTWALLFASVSFTACLIASTVRRAIVSVRGYDKPTGSPRLVVSGYVIFGLGVALTIINPALGPLIYVPGVACLVVSIRQDKPDVGAS